MSLLPTCKELRENLTEYEEGMLPWHRRAAFALHLLMCESCRGFRAGLRALGGVFRRCLAPSEPPEAAKKALEAAMKAIRSGGGNS